MEQIIIIGAGASGMMAAIKSKNNNNKITILERNNNCGKKILITGSGKCNYLNDDFKIDHYRSENINFIKQFINENNKILLIDEFKKIGIEPKIKNGYYYPASNTAVSMQNALLREMKEKNINIINNVFVKSIKKINNKFIINDKYQADKIIIAAGSSACPKCGTDGSLYKILKDLGLKIVKPLPALVQLKSDGKYLKEWAGIRTDVKLSLYENNKLIRTQIGEIQLTDYGISGICTFQLSGQVIKGLNNKLNETIKINFLPEINNYDEFITNRVKTLKNRNIIELFEGLINYKLLYVLTKQAGIDNKKTYYDLTKEEKNKLKNILICFNININGYNDFDKAQVCQGGVSLNEINNNFECKKIKNLYIVGELLDVDGDCGGYNLAFAFLSGLIAGKDINND